MTQATKSREMIQLIRGILSKHDIENLALEMELAQAFKEMSDPQKTGRTPAELRRSIEVALQVGVAKVTKQRAMLDRAEIALRRISYNLRGASQFEQERFYKHLVDSETQGQTIEVFVKWASEDAYWHDKISSINKIIELWLKAFPAPSLSRSKEAYHEDDSEYVIAPRFQKK
jgi:hypothetical protein